MPATDALFTDTVLNDLINVALHHTESLFDWPWLEADQTFPTVAAQDNYAFAADFLRVIGAQVGDYPPLERVSIERLRAMSAAAGRPFFYALFRNKLWVRPVPSGTAPNIVVMYILTEPDLAADGTSPIMPVTWHQAIVEYAAHLGFRRARNQQDAGAALADFQSWIERMQARHELDSDSEGGGRMAPDQQPKPATVAEK